MVKNSGIIGGPDFSNSIRTADLYYYENKWWIIQEE